MDLGTALDAVQTAPRLLEAMRGADALAAAAAIALEDDGGLLTSAVRTGDPLTAIGAVHALAAGRFPAAGEVLTDLLTDDRRHLAEHAVDALRLVPPVERALPHLVKACHDGAFTGMLAQRTLEQWAAHEPEKVLASLSTGLRTGLATAHDDAGRARLVETLGLVPSPSSTPLLLQVAGDESEAAPVRAAALAALGDGPAADRNAEALLATMARGVGPLARTARLALHDLRPAAPGQVPESLTVAQLFLHADIDGQLHHSGRGDTGGIATLLVQLGDALLRRRPPVGRVITISGGTPDPAQFPIGRMPSARGSVATSALLTPGHHYARVPLSQPVGASRAWPARVATRRGVRRVLRAAGRVDVIHLRMADVGSMAAAEVAHELGIPVVLTVAPDPQALIDARDRAASLTREDFGAADLVEHLWFRDRLLRDLAARADHLVLFPRPQVESDLRRYLGLDLSTERERVSVVGEGIDVSGLDRTVREALGETTPGPAVAGALDELDTMLSALPPHRRHLPLVVSVGRLNAVKGMATLVRAWSGDPRLHDRCNLLIIGGDLDDPNEEESAELARIQAVVPPAEAATLGLLMAGHRPNTTAIAWLAATGRRHSGADATPGVYASASLKEEFGIAILEALAVGLVVVAPDGGGPATYVAHGTTGILADTSTPATLADAVHEALDLAAAPGSDRRVEQARDTVRTRFGIDAMATSLDAIYRQVAAAHEPVKPRPAVVEGAS